MCIYPYEYINAQIEHMKYLFIHLKFESTTPIPSRAKLQVSTWPAFPWEIRKAEIMRCSWPQYVPRNQAGPYDLRPCYHLWM